MGTKIEKHGEPDKTYDKGSGLLTIVRKFKVTGKYTTKAQLEGSEIHLAFETPDPEHSDCLLASQGIDGSESVDAQKSILVRTYVQLPVNLVDTVQLGSDLITYSESGLKQVEQRFVVRRGHVLTGDVGTTTGAAGDINDLILSGNGFAERGKVSAVVVKRWAEPGLIDSSEVVGPASLPGTKRLTYVSQGVPFYPVIDTDPDPDEWVPASTGTMPDTKAKLVAKNNGGVNGFARYTRTYLVSADPTKTIEGVKYTYDDFVNIDVPGTIECKAETVAMTGIDLDLSSTSSTGSIAELDVTPKTKTEIGVTVTIEITTAPPAGTARAFNIDALNCAVSVKHQNLRQGAGATVTWGSDTNRMSGTGYSQAFSASVALRHYPGYYFLNAGATGEISYIGRAWYEVVNNKIGTEQTLPSRQQSILSASGSDAAAYAAAYNTTGLVDQKPRPVFVTLDGTVYWEIIKWTVT